MSQGEFDPFLSKPTMESQLYPQSSLKYFVIKKVGEFMNPIKNNEFSIEEQLNYQLARILIINDKSEKIHICTFLYLVFFMFYHHFVHIYVLFCFVSDNSSK